MNFFKKTSVAVVVAILMVALCCVWGYARVNNQDPAAGTHHFSSTLEEHEAFREAIRG